MFALPETGPAHSRFPIPPEPIVIKPWRPTIAYKAPRGGNHTVAQSLLAGFGEHFAKEMAPSAVPGSAITTREETSSLVDIVKNGGLRSGNTGGSKGGR